MGPHETLNQTEERRYYMTQGRATTSKMGSTKTEPISHAVPPAYPAGLGVMKGNHGDCGTINLVKVPMYEGRGLEAPKTTTTIHRKGSQS
jgi:hypothetical protein